MKFKWIFFLLCLMAHICFSVEKTTKNKLDIESDEAYFDKRNHLNIYTGHVKVTQQDMVINGDRVQVKIDDNNRIEEAIVLGKPAVIIKNDLEKSWQAQAYSIYYFPKIKKLILIGSAKVSQEKRSLSADKIEYQIDTQNVKAFSSKKTPALVSIVQ